MPEHPALERAQNFAADLTATIQAVFPASPDLQARVEPSGGRVQISTFDQESKVGRLPLFINGKQVAYWKLSMLADLDWQASYLKIMKSNFSLFASIDKPPLVRYEFDDGMRTAPVAHWQFHGERGAFSYLLGVAQAAGRDVKPYSLSSVHFPVGGPRMRPGVDDLLEFMVRECGFDVQPKWQQAVLADRERYRTIQARTIARDMQTEVAEVLRNEGWTVEPPETAPELGSRFLSDW